MPDKMNRKIGLAIADALRELWLIIGITLLVLVVLEGVARVGYTLRDNQYNAQVSDWLLGTDIYRDQAWAAEYWHERDQTDWVAYAEWHSYIYWRHAPFQGKYINIDQNGIRYTWNKSAFPSPNQVKVFVFGGSALWGTGVRDEYTIPSLISKKLNSQNQEVWVKNFGEEGYVSTQEVIALMLELQKGDVPDVVVFYDGANDVFSAFQQGVAGIPQNEYNRAAEFNQLNWRGEIVEKLALYRLVKTLVETRHGPARTESADLELENAVLDKYVANMQIVEALAQDYGFSVLFYWQPVIYNKRILSTWEKLQLDVYGEARFFGQADRVLKDRAVYRDHSSFNDLADAFGDQGDTVFIDLFHISEAGNDRVSNLMLQTLVPVVSHARPLRSEGN
jgi:lysophospholipase L1-like esterase